jgi:hypothetical protein
MALIETTIISYLNSYAGITCPAYGDTPKKDLPESYILVQKSGSSCRDHVHSAMIVIQSISASSKASAAALNEIVVGAMAGLITLDDVFSCRLNSDYDFTDVATKRYRYQAVFNVTYTREAN